MRSCRRSLDDDSTDYHTHTWAALFFLVLSLATWLLPLSPALQLPQSKPNTDTSRSVAPKVSAPIPQPTFKIDCWCPAQFEDAHIRYTNALCGQSLNMALQGINPSDNSLASLYHYVNGTRVTASFTSAPRTTAKKFMPQEPKEKPKSFPVSSARRFMRVTTPMALFLMALCLRAPVFVRSLLSSFVGGVNVHQTLKATVQSAGLMSEDRYKLYSDLAESVTNILRTRPWASGVLYIFYKLLLFIAVIVVLVMVNGTLLPQAKNLNSLLLRPIITHHNQEGDTMGTINGNAQRSIVLNSSEDNELETYFAEFGTVLHCAYSIRQLQNVHNYTVQCSISPKQESDSGGSDIPPKIHTNSQNMHGKFLSQGTAYELYETLFQIIQIYATILAVASSSSLIVWVSKLVSGSCRRRLPLDAVLLLQMARNNAGPDVANAFSQTGLGTAGKCQEHVTLHE